MRGDEVRDDLALRAQSLVGRSDVLNGAVRHDQFLRDNVIGRRPVNRNARSRRIVRDHAADRRPRAGGNVRPKTETVRLEKRVQLIEHHAGTGADRARFEIQLGDLAVVAKELNNQSVADRAARQTGARAARSDGQIRVRRRRDDSARLLCTAWECDGCRFELIKRGIGRVELARQSIEGNVAIGDSKSGMLSRSHRAAWAFRAVT